MAGHDADLPIAGTTRAVLRTLAHHLRELPRVALTPFLLAFLAQGGMLALRPVLPAPADDGGFAAQHAVTLTAMGLTVVSYTVFLVDWLRLLVLGPGPETLRPRLTVGRRDLRVFGTAVLVMVLVILTAVPWVLIGMAVRGLPGVPALVAVVMLVSMLTAGAAAGLIMPPVAVDRVVPLSRCWQAVRPVIGRLAGVVTLTLLPLHLLVSVSGFAYAGAIDGGVPVIPVMTVTLVLEYLMLALLGALWTTVYRARLGDPAQPDGTHRHTEDGGP